MADSDNAVLPVEKKELHVPDYNEVVKVLQDGLKANFSEVSVGVVDCPDLTKEPFTLAAPGLCGRPRMADIGGVPYLMPLVQRHKKYNFQDIAEKIELPGAFLIGAGAGPLHVVGTNSEMMTNINLNNGDNSTYTCKMHTEDENSYILEKGLSLDCSLLANIYASDGKPGKVIEVKASTRTGPENFVTCMRKALKEKYGDKPVGMGGTFIIEKGKAKIHIMPDFSEVPLDSNEKVDQWLKFFDMKAILVCLSVFISHDPGLDLRVEHTHCFNKHDGGGGHYHYDVTPDDVVYHGYFVPSEYMYRIDAPTETHMIGRD
ncbi:ester hydrolase C11orf54-like [Saccoglossus kowalevskii]|uniref:Ester hydrolase C11orf54-like n=1 Tax=Saccoglossus kowalevskii TaxID=10224 RepID=A0ABM0GVW3_SACKO|nr:PREDICTED: ester hydrolase C11orf54-like [Saccoglossus kowalevskii]